MAKKVKIPTRSGGYMRLFHEIFESPAYRDLSTVERALLLEFQRIYLPSRNGVLSISTRNAAQRLNVSEDTACKAFYGLVSHGLLVLMEGHYWQQRKAREWRLTFEPCNNREPTDEWKFWKPDKPFSVPRKNPRPEKRGQTALITGAENSSSALGTGAEAL